MTIMGDRIRPTNPTDWNDELIELAVVSQKKYKFLRWGLKQQQQNHRVQRINLNATLEF